MRSTPVTGLTHSFDYVVPATRTVPNLLPESTEFARMPEVLATGYLVGLVEWACMRLLAPHLDDAERTLGVHVDLSHEAPTVPGSTVHISVELTEVDGRILTFAILARDDHAEVCRGSHQRAIVGLSRFEVKLQELQVVSR